MLAALQPDAWQVQQQKPVGLKPAVVQTDVAGANYNPRFADVSGGRLPEHPHTSLVVANQ